MDFNLRRIPLTNMSFVYQQKIRLSVGIYPLHIRVKKKSHLGHDIQVQFNPNYAGWVTLVQVPMRVVHEKKGKNIVKPIQRGQ